MPTGGSWTPLKNDATDFVQGTGGPDITPASLVTDFIRVNGGLKGLSTGSGSAPLHGSGSGPGQSGGHKDGGGGGRSSAIHTARNLGRFLSRVGEVGLDTALRERGLGNIVGKSAGEVAQALLDEFAGPASTLENALVREALADVRDEMLENAETFEDVERCLDSTMDQIGVFGILASFFGHYIFKMFCRNFYEEWLKKVGDARAANSLQQIKDYVISSLRAKLANRKIDAVDWKKKEGILLVEDILGETIEVFGVKA